jgi:hypothetical protein
MRKFALMLAVVCLLPVAAACESLSISASVDKNTAQVGEQINLQIVVAGDTSNVPEPSLPPLSNFTVYSSGRSQSVSIVNGKVSSSVTFNYAIVPNAEGKQTIGSARIVSGGKEYRTQPIEINVTKAGTAVNPQPGGQTPQQAGQAPAPASAPSGRDLFVEASVDKKTAYVNEQVTLSFRFYRKINLLSQPQYQPPATTGFLSEDLPPQRNYYADVGGSRYLVTEVKTALFPFSAGKHTIGSAVLRCAMEDGSAPDDFFARFFSQGRQIALQTDPVNVNVLELPREGKPADFSGAVGRFTVNSSVDKSALETGEALTLSVTIAGTGNVKTVGGPPVEAQNFRKYDTAASLNVEKKNYIVSGSKTFKTVLIPAVPGRLLIPAVRFSYFDPSAGAYKTLTTSPVTVSVKQGKAVVQLPPVSGAPQSGRVVVEDVRYIKTKLSGASNQRVWKPGALFTAFQFAPLACFLIFWRYNSYRERLMSDVGLMRLTRSYRRASKRLKELRERGAVGEADIERACGELFDIFTNYIADKLNVSAEGLTLENAVALLTAKDCPEERVSEVKSVWEEMDFCRYAPALLRRTAFPSADWRKGAPASTDTGKVSELVSRTQEAIIALERWNKWK